VELARRNPQTAGKREREQAKREKRERKQQKRAAAAAARLEEPTAPENDRQTEDPTPSEDA
jgi:hypothetical protein